MLRRFELHQPVSVQEACEILSVLGENATLYAGGTELLLVMKEELAHFTHLIDIKKIPGLRGASLENDGKVLCIGGLTTHRQIEKDVLVRRHLHLLAEVEHQIANVRVRSAGTIGGNLCFAEPHSDPATLFLACGATVELNSCGSQREMPFEEFLLGPFETARNPDEVLTRIRLPLLAHDVGRAYERFALQERPLVNVAAILWIKGGLIHQARISVGSVGPCPARMVDAERVLIEERPQTKLLNHSAERAAACVEPVGDLYGSAEYKRHLVRVLTLKVLEKAVEQAKGAEHAD